MKLGITAPRLLERKSDERDVFTLVNQLREFATLTYQLRVRLNTPGDGLYLPMWTDLIPELSAFVVQAVVIGQGVSGACWYMIDAGYRNVAGTLSLIGGSAVTQSREDLAGADARFTTSGANLSLEVRDDGAEAMSWTAYITAAGAA